MLILTFVSSSEIRGWLVFNHPFTNISMWCCYISISFFLAWFVLMVEVKSRLIYLKQTKLYGKRGGQSVQETSKNSTLQSILPNVCSISFIYSLHFFSKSVKYFSIAFPARKTGVYSSEARGGHRDDTGSGIHDVREENGNSIHSVLSRKGWLNFFFSV